MVLNVKNYYQTRYTMFKWRINTSVANKLIMAFFLACITGIMAQILIPLPWTPVPITAQTFGVLISGILLGRWWGGISQTMYLVVGLAGVPWFAGFTAGYNILLGANGGYLIGFILAALFLGYFSDHYVNSRNFKPMLALMLLANFAIIYIPGILGLGLWLYLVKGSFPNLITLISLGLLPFLIGDLVKIGGAAAFTKAITPKEPFNGEVDGDGTLRRLRF